MHNWNDEKLKRHYDRTLKHVKDDKYYNFTDEELANPYLDKLSHKSFDQIIFNVACRNFESKLEGALI